MPTITAEKAIEMATINGARSLGVDHLTGSLEAGKKADIVIHDSMRPESRPGLDPINMLVYSARSAAVGTVIVDGEVILRGGEFTRVDQAEELRKIETAARDLYRRMSYDIKHRWPVE